MTSNSPSVPDWTFVLDSVLPRLGMWTGRPTYERAVFLVEGFDLARGSRVAPLLTAWAHERYGETSVGWPWVLMRLSLGSPRDDVEGRDLGDLTQEENEAALTLLHDALSESVRTL